MSILLLFGCEEEQMEGGQLDNNGNMNTSSCTTFETGMGGTQEWIKSVGGSGEEAHGHFIMTCSDGGYLQIGETGFFPNSAKILVVKVNSSGDLIWKKEFGNVGANLGNSAIETSDAYIIVGSLNQNSTIIKLNKSNGSEIWSNTHNNGGSNSYEHLAEIPNGYVTVGYKNAEDNSNTFFTEGQGLMTFLDTDGNKISEKNINSQMAQGYRIKNIGNELIISGLTEDAQDYSLIKTNLSGNIIWHSIFGGNNADHCFAMDVGNDGSIFLSGHTLSGTQNWDTYTMKIDASGNQLWEMKKGNPRGFDANFIHDEVWDLKATPDGGCIIIAGTGDEYSYSAECGDSGDLSDIWKVYLIKFSATGEIEWQELFGAENNWAGEAIDLTNDGGAIIGVDNGSFGFLKLSSF